MKVSPSHKEARILVVGDNAVDAEQVCSMLGTRYKAIEACTDPVKSHAVFDRIKPQVLVLAFKSIAACERYYLGLYRHSDAIQSMSYRTLLLCDKDSLDRAYNLCLEDCFDDYVLYWPMVHDAMRLAMSVHLALCTLDQKLAPASSERARPVQPAQDLVPQISETRPLLLVVDDDEFMRRLLHQVLCSAHYDVETVGSASEAHTFLGQRQPQLILMDFQLPDANGVALTHELKSGRSHAKIPVIMLTSQCERQVIIDSRKAGAVDFLAKPFDRDILLKKVALHLGR